MTYRTYAVVVAALGAATLVLAAEPASSATTTHITSATRAMPHAHANAVLRHRHRNNFGAVWWPDYGGDFYAPDASALAQMPPSSGDINYTYKYDVPWDWAHRFPPNVTPSAHPYVPGCNSEAVTVPGHGGDQTVNITRCY